MASNSLSMASKSLSKLFSKVFGSDDTSILNEDIKVDITNELYGTKMCFRHFRLADSEFPNKIASDFAITVAFRLSDIVFHEKYTAFGFGCAICSGDNFSREIGRKISSECYDVEEDRFPLNLNLDQSLFLKNCPNDQFREEYVQELILLEILNKRIMSRKIYEFIKAGCTLV